jgi:hypothetical protein
MVVFGRTSLAKLSQEAAGPALCPNAIGPKRSAGMMNAIPNFINRVSLVFGVNIRAHVGANKPWGSLNGFPKAVRFWVTVATILAAIFDLRAIGPAETFSTQTPAG